MGAPSFASIAASVSFRLAMAASTALLSAGRLRRDPGRHVGQRLGDRCQVGLEAGDGIAGRRLGVRGLQAGERRIGIVDGGLQIGEIGRRDRYLGLDIGQRRVGRADRLGEVRDARGEVGGGDRHLGLDVGQRHVGFADRLGEVRDARGEVGGRGRHLGLDVGQRRVGFADRLGKVRDALLQCGIRNGGGSPLPFQLADCGIGGIDAAGDHIKPGGQGIDALTAAEDRKTQQNQHQAGEYGRADAIPILH